MTEKYPHFFCPGPTVTPSNYLLPYGTFLGSSDIQSEFNTVYDEAETLLKELLHAPDTTSAVIMSGEGMLALWAALSSVLNNGDKVVSLNYGLYGKGIGEMAAGKGAEVYFVDFPADEPVTLADCKEGGKLWDVVTKVRPKMITLVHCETPTGILLPEDILNQIGALSRTVGALLYVDMVSSVGGVDINLSNNMIDLALIGSQKCFSLPPDLSIIMVNERAWQSIEEKYENIATRYIGYDSIYSFKDPVQKKDSADRLFPYTMNWNAIQALVIALKHLLRDGGIQNVYNRHSAVSKYFISKIRELGFKIFPIDEKYSSPTVTAIYVPQNISWKEFDHKLRENGVIVGGSYGPFEGKIFRVGHMGSQAQIELIDLLLPFFQSLVN